MKFHKILFNTEGSTGGGGSNAGADGSQDGKGSDGSNGNEGNQTVSKQEYDKLQKDFQNLSSEIKEIAKTRDELKSKIKAAEDEKKH